MTAVAAETTTTKSSPFSKLGRILKIVTEDEKTTNGEKSNLKKVSDFIESVENGSNTVETNADSTLSDIKDLQTAIKNNDIETVKKLLNVENANTKTTDGQSSLALAVLNDNSEMIKTIIKAGGDINAKTKTGDTQVSVAAALGKINALKTLINCGADLTITNNRGWTPLHAAIAANQINSVKILINSGIDVNPTSNDSISPLALARIMKRTEIVEILKNAGATYNI